MIEEIKKLYCDSDNMQETAKTPSFCIKSFGDYNIPQYIRNGLEWLSSKNPYVDGEATDE